MERSPMTDPAVAFIHKLAWWLLSFLTMVGAPVLAFFLGLKFIPLDPKNPHDDVTRRLLGAAVSSFLVGGVSLVYLMQSMRWVFEAAADVMRLIHWMPEIGPLMIIFGVLLVSALPGWWFVGALVRRVAGQDYDALLDKLNKHEVHP